MRFSFANFMARQKIDIRAEGKYPVVIKADGLALGKGVLICEN